MFFSCFVLKKAILFFSSYARRQLLHYYVQLIFLTALLLLCYLWLTLSFEICIVCLTFFVKEILMGKFDPYLDEPDVLKRIMDLRARVHPEMLSNVDATSFDHALNRGVSVIQKALVALEQEGITLDQIEPGFSKGHTARLYAYALIICSADPDNTVILSPAARFLGLVSGTLAKIGLVFTDRYSEKARPTGYAEKSGLFLSDFLFQRSLISTDERDLIAYSAAAQSHYFGTIPSDSLRQVPEYDEVIGDKVMWSAILARWPNRCDSVDPAFFARHWITRAKSLNPGHVDFGIDGFHDSKFAEHMNPIIDKSTHTMLYHFNMFVESQSNPKLPYGKYDFGKMLELLGILKPQMLRIVERAQRRDNAVIFSSDQQEAILNAFSIFMIALDGSKDAPDAVSKIMGAFRGLDESVRQCWLHTFIQVMYEHIGWFDEMYQMLSGMPKAWLSLPTIVPPDQSLLDYFVMPKECVELAYKYQKVVIPAHG